MQYFGCGHCTGLGLVVLATERDHIIPLYDGGTEDVENTQGLACATRPRVWPSGCVPTVAVGAERQRAHVLLASRRH